MINVKLAQRVLASLAPLPVCGITSHLIVVL